MAGKRRKHLPDPRPQPVRIAELLRRRRSMTYDEIVKAFAVPTDRVDLQMARRAAVIRNIQRARVLLESQGIVTATTPRPKARGKGRQLVLMIVSPPLPAEAVDEQTLDEQTLGSETRRHLERRLRDEAAADARAAAREAL